MDHIPQVDRLGLDLDNATAVKDNQDPKESRKQSILRCIQSMTHACQCRDANCKLQSCHKMKTVITHTKLCRKKTDSGCPICKQLIALSCYHAKQCHENKCRMPYCEQIKFKLLQNRYK